MAILDLEKIPGGSSTLTVVACVVGVTVVLAYVGFEKSRGERELRARAAAFAAARQSTEPAPSDRSDSWYAANGDFSACFETAGPAERIEAIQGNGEQPQVNELRGPTGGLKVEVGAPAGGGLQMTYVTYYRLQSDCQASISERTALADRYR